MTGRYFSQVDRSLRHGKNQVDDLPRRIPPALVADAINMSAWVARDQQSVNRADAIGQRVVGAVSPRETYLPLLET